MEEALRELDRLDREEGLGAMPGRHSGRHRRPRRTTSPALVGVVVTAALLSGVVLVAPGDELQTVRRLVGLAPDRYGSPPEFTAGEGSFDFLVTQPGSDAPVGYDPCTPVRYVVNPAGAPSDWAELVDTAADHTSWATGLELQDAGTTDERPFDSGGRQAAGEDQRVVIGFADSEEFEELSDAIAGIGGSVTMRGGVGRNYFRSGSIALDTDVFDAASSGGEREMLQAIIDHEFGHVVGLDHVDDPGELMYRSNLGRTDYGPGDLEGFARLGSIPCR